MMGRIHQKENNFILTNDAKIPTKKCKKTYKNHTTYFFFILQDIICEEILKTDRSMENHIFGRRKKCHNHLNIRF